MESLSTSMPTEMMEGADYAVPGDPATLGDQSRAAATAGLLARSAPRFGPATLCE